MRRDKCLCGARVIDHAPDCPFPLIGRAQDDPRKLDRWYELRDAMRLAEARFESNYVELLEAEIRRLQAEVVRLTNRLDVQEPVRATRDC